MIPRTAQPVKLEHGHCWQPVENIPKVRQNTALVYPSMRLSAKREGISQGLALVLSGVFILAATGNDRTEQPVAELCRVASFVL